MANKTIKALIGFSDGVISMGVGEIRSVAEADANKFIAGGLAEVYTDPVEPSGSVSIIANGTYDVTDKASAVVNVTVCTITYNVNGGTGSVDAVSGAAGDSVTLNNGSTITPPSDKVFKGWGTTDTATETVASPYTLTENVTLYAVYGDE